MGRVKRIVMGVVGLILILVGLFFAGVTYLLIETANEVSSSMPWIEIYLIIIGFGALSASMVVGGGILLVKSSRKGGMSWPIWLLMAFSFLNPLFTPFTVAGIINVISLSC